MVDTSTFGLAFRQRKITIHGNLSAPKIQNKSTSNSGNSCVLRWSQIGDCDGSHQKTVKLSILFSKCLHLRQSEMYSLTRVNSCLPFRKYFSHKKLAGCVSIQLSILFTFSNNTFSVIRINQPQKYQMVVNAFVLETSYWNSYFVEGFDRTKHKD